ncbi:AimR family lysis-lysogeny pheromone receptor [Bacillus thuringiensis]|uniref:Prophage helix-turn-helix protein n=1 Tax=Bacillus thuringiensis Bt18247 TaxID=1423143 RepID=A0A9W3SY03_BACTU|nr:AimR family lysis-lysogeny pheromone receptor [Bacillus thuringiensis]AOM13840.1 prophage helix-turn-helix protein [Bacillus thuringiensis Bt18247]
MKTLDARTYKQQVMNTIITKLKDDLFSAKITNHELASFLEIAPSTLSSILNGKTEISFNFLIKIIIKLYGKPFVTLQNEIVSNYLLHAKPENQREALEYASFGRELDNMKKLVEREKNSATEVNRECAKIYDITYKHFKIVKQYDPYDFSDELEEYKNKVKSNEAKILIDILLCQAMYQMKDYKRLYKRIQNIEPNVRSEKVPNKFICSSFLVRIKEIIIVVYMMQNEIEKARETCMELLDICEKNPNLILQKANVFYNLGESFLLENYAASKKYLEQSLFILNKANFKEDKDIKRKKRRIESTIIFLKIHHYRDIHTLPDVLDLDDQAYLEYKKGNLVKAEELLMKLERKNGSLNEFSTFYLGLIRKDRRLIEKSYMMFIQKHSYFYANLPKCYLENI